jgi:hypothetical protein
MAQDDPKIKLEAQRKKIVEIVCEYLGHSRQSAFEWEQQIDKTYRMLNGHIDWSHKKPTQAKIHLNRVGAARERVKSIIKQSMLSFDDWISCEPVGVIPENSLLDEFSSKRALVRFLDNSNIKTDFSDCVSVGCAENLMTLKVRPEVCEYKMFGKKYKKLKFNFDVLKIREYRPDPDANLYEIHETSIDKHILLKMASDQPSPEKPYRLEVVKDLLSGQRQDKDLEDANKGNTIVTRSLSRRVSVVVHEFWGTILNDDGTVMEWDDGQGNKFPLENIRCSVANESTLIQDPESNPRWTGTSPFVSTTLMRYPDQKIGPALLKWGTDMNKAEDELMSASVDAAMRAAFNLIIVKEDGLANPEQASGGFEYGDTILQNSTLSPGDDVVKSVSMGTLPGEVFQVMGEIQRSNPENMLMDQMNMSGALGGKNTLATERVQAQQVISGVFESIGMDLEDIFVEKLAKEIFCEILQHAKYLDDEDLYYIFAGDEEKMRAFRDYTPKELFEAYGNAFRFKGKGIRSLVVNNKSSQSLIMLYGTLASNPVLMQNVKLDFSPNKILSKILKGFNLDPDELKATPAEQQMEILKQQAMEQQMRLAELQGQQPPGAPGQQAAPQPDQNPEGVNPGQSYGS